MMVRPTFPPPWPRTTVLVVIGGLLAGALVGGLAASAGIDLAIGGRLPWYTSRAAGLTAYLSLSAATLLGLAISTRLLDGRIGRGALFALHQHLSWLALGFTGLHVGALLLDTYQPFRLIDVLLPFASAYRPVAVGLGVVSAYLLVLLIASFSLRARIGQHAWRAFHYTSFGLYVMATAHGLLAGSSAGEPWSQWLYLASGALALLLTLYRLQGGNRQ